MANIKRLLNKKGWTGRELGQLELTILADSYKNALTGNSEAPSIVDPAEFQKMVDSITDREQGRTYNGYLAIHEWLSIKVNIANTQYQSAQLCLAKLNTYIEQAIGAENLFQFIEQLPAIMTEKQYRDAKEAGLNSWLHEDDGTERGDSLAALIERGIHYYADLLKKKPAKPNPLKAIRKKYIAEPVKSKLILESYNKVMGEGYYTIEDGSGRRSDQMTHEEWQAAITSPLVREAMDAEDERGNEITKQIAYRRVLDRAKVIYNGGTEEDADKAQEKADYEVGIATPAKWHYYEDPPKDLTKWDIIEADIMYFYGIIFCGMDGSEAEYLEELEDFLTEFRELADAIIADIEKLYLTGENPLQPLLVEGQEPLRNIASLPLKDWSSTVFSWEDLYKHNVYGFKEDAEADTTIFDGNNRALFNGIAILRPSDLVGRSRCIDERGYYVEPDLRNPLTIFSLEEFFTDSEDYARSVEIVEDARNQLINAYYYVLGHNTQVDLVAAYYDVPELSIFKLDLPRLAERVDALDSLVPLLYKQIKDTDYRDKDLQARKMEVLKDIFPPLNLNSYTIPEENIERAKELFKDFRAFRREREQFDSLICIRPQAEGEDGEGA